MLILLFVIFVTLFILASIFIDEYNYDIFKWFIQLCTVIGTAITVIAFVCVAYDLSK